MKQVKDLKVGDKLYRPYVWTSSIDATAVIDVYTIERITSEPGQISIALNAYCDDRVFNSGAAITDIHNTYYTDFGAAFNELKQRVQKSTDELTRTIETLGKLKRQLENQISNYTYAIHKHVK